MDYTNNQVRVYNNSCLKLYQETELSALEKEFAEIIDLIEIFGKHEKPEKLEILTERFNRYMEIFEPKIKEQTRLLKNTEKRIRYNSDRC